MLPPCFWALAAPRRGQRKYRGKENPRKRARARYPSSSVPSRMLPLRIPDRRDCRQLGRNPGLRQGRQVLRAVSAVPQPAACPRRRRFHPARGRPVSATPACVRQRRHSLCRRHRGAGHAERQVQHLNVPPPSLTSDSAPRCAICGSFKASATVDRPNRERHGRSVRPGIFGRSVRDHASTPLISSPQLSRRSEYKAKRGSEIHSGARSPPSGSGTSSRWRRPASHSRRRSRRANNGRWPGFTSNCDHCSSFRSG